MNKKKNKGKKQDQPYKPTRVRLPKDDEVIGVIDQRVGGSRMMIRCVDGKSRNCKVPGRLRRKLWLREGDTVIVRPWDFDDEKAEVLYKYYPSQVNWLKRKGYLKKIQEEF